MNTTITGESIQEVYNWYINKSLIVNRKYQRKLVWTKDEKAKLIDTIRNEFPIPLILLAEVTQGKEIIDGMQRLNAIFDFIENKVPFNNQYFDLETLGTTKKLKDDGILIQKEPILDREASLKISNYKLAISIYKEGEEFEKINEIFRRINSSGRKLSRQEIRQVGLTGGFSEFINVLASKVRGDVSRKNIIELNEMSKISISIQEDNNGIKANKIYWCTNTILDKKDIRDSEDEALIANIVIQILTNKGYRISNDELDFAYGKSLEQSKEDKAEKRNKEIDMKLSTYDNDKLEKEFIGVFDGIKNLNIKFNSKRIYIILFLVFHDLMFKENMIIKSTKISELNKALSDTLSKNLDTTQGGTWAKDNICRNFDVLKGAISKYFEKSPSSIVNEQRITEIENIITTSDTESSYYDFKQGFHNIDSSNKFNEKLFKKILETICAISNEAPNEKGYLILGIADKVIDKDKIEKLYGEIGVSKQVGNFFITGLNGESSKYISKDNYYQTISDKLEKSKKEFKGLKNILIKPINYYDRYLFLIEITSGEEVTLYDNKVFYRSGAQTMEAKEPTKIVEISNRFK